MSDVSRRDQLINDIHNHNINYVTREVYVHGHYESNSDLDDEPGVEYRMATTFVKNLHILEQDNSQNILVHMHTIGGGWADGMGMFNAIRLIKSPVTVLAYAQASSMSGVLLQAADKRVLMPDCEMMIHHGSIFLDDNSLAARSAVDANNRACKRMLQVFGQRAMHGKFFSEREFNLSKVMGYIDRKIRTNSDWYLTPEEAIYYGFADGIFGEKGFENLEKIRVKKKG